MSESDLLELLRNSARASASVPIPIGDDLAALRIPPSDLLLVGVDQVLDDVHVDTKVHSPEAIGAKAMNRNLSDCAAMACVPIAATVALTLPRGAGVEYAARIIEGARRAGEAFGCAIVGGDTASWPGPLAVTVSILGRSAGLQPVRRSGARPGDSLFVTGPLGGSIRGRHMTFAPRVDLAIELAARFEIHAMLDLSDGIARDLPRLCVASNVGAILDASLVPIHDDVDASPRLDHALSDGEDYELLFAAPSCDHPRAIRIGEIIEGSGVFLRDGASTRPLAAGGWDHGL